MTARWLAGRCVRVVLAALTLAGGLITIAPGAASASTCVSWTGIQPPNPGSDNLLLGVAVLTPCNAWAVGTFSTLTASRTLIEHWNGTAWKVVPSPNPSSTGNFLFGVAATSAGNAWAVGDYENGTADRTLIEHWNGTAWKVVPSPNPGGSAGNVLSGVAATSAGNAWAVGDYSIGGQEQMLIEHWNGTAWKVVPSPNPAGSAGNRLFGVAATSAGNA